MINRIRVRNFKSILKAFIELKNINLIVGTNSSGKSTLLQAVLLVVQNINYESGLNGRIVRVGSFNEAKCSYSREDVITMDVELNHSLAGVKFIRLPHENAEYGIELIKSKDFDMNSFSIKDRFFQYISCNRIGPMNLYSKNLDMNEAMGVESEYAISYLNAFGDDQIEQELIKDESDYTLLGQVNWWLNYIINASVSTEQIPRTDVIRVAYSMNEINNIRPTNIGSGISYMIGIIITCLSMPKSGVVIIENPEIHLHPRAQSRLCEFLYFVSITGRQLIIESHSDHIFNAFRVGITKKTMDRKNVNILFSYLNDNNVSSFSEVEIDNWGNVKNQQKDLFDQFDIDINRMLGFE